MRRKVARPCAVTGCPNLVTDPNEIYCLIHRAKMKQQERERRKERGTDAHYGPRWERISKRFLRSNPVCELCGKPSEIAHHIIERSEGGSDDYDNLMALCRACHTALHNKRISRKRGGYGDRGVKISGSNEPARAGGNLTHTTSKLKQGGDREK